MPKRKKAANGEGSIYARPDGRYDCKLPVWTPTGTKNLRTTKRDKTEARRWLTKKRAQRDEGTLLAFEARTLSVGAYLDRWLTTIEGSVSRHTYRDYRDKVELHLKPALGRIRLQDLTALHLSTLYQAKRKTHSVRTIQYIHTTIRKALEQAEAWDLVRKNVARFAKPPKTEHTERRYFTPDEARRFLAAVQGHKDEALYLLAVTTGMRRGELLGLKWSDIDLEARTLRVERSLDTQYGPAKENAPKRAASKRPISLFPEIIQSLQRHKQRQRLNKLRYGPKWQERGYVFTTRYGTPQRGSSVLSRGLKPLLAKADLPPLTFHELRHSCATFFALLGVNPKTAMSMLGHSNIQTTLQHYTHVLDEMETEAGDKLRELLFEKEERGEG